jgi:catechol 2,3-dioxygenase-like lactoylglutathione lyase family enzyme
MSSTQLSADAAGASGATGVPMRFEVAVLPVADVDRAKDFYQGLGWRLDGDGGSGDFRVVQMTPPGSNASIIFGKGVTTADPGSVDRLLLAVDDIDRAHDELASHGVEVSEVFHDSAGGPVAGFHADRGGRAPGRDPDGGTYASYASFSDPDGNRWMLQEVTDRAPGRVEPIDNEALAALLLETAEHHGAYEAIAPPHDWWDWYAAYLDVRQRGGSSENASAAADRYMAQVKHVVVS